LFRVPDLPGVMANLGITITPVQRTHIK
jgi:hypothetical protein